MMKTLQAAKYIVSAASLLAVVNFVRPVSWCSSHVCDSPRLRLTPLCCDPKVEWIQTEVTTPAHPIRTKYVEVDVRWRDDVGTLSCPCDPPHCKKPARYMWERVYWRPPRGWCEDHFETLHHCPTYVSHWCFGGPDRLKYQIVQSKKYCPATCGYCKLYSKQKQSKSKSKRKAREVFQRDDSNKSLDEILRNSTKKRSEKDQDYSSLSSTKGKAQLPHVTWNTSDDVSGNSISMEYVHTDFETTTVGEDGQVLNQRSKRTATMAGCMGDLGLKDGRVLNSQIKASSVYVSTGRFSAKNARLDHKLAWCASKIKSEIENIDQYLQITFPFVMKFTGVATQGLEKFDFWVKYYWVRYSTDGAVWKEYNNDKGKRMIFPGNVNGKLTRYNRFKTTFLARYIRVYPSDWRGLACLRVELYGCKVECMDPIGMYDGRVKSWQIAVSMSRFQMYKTNKYTPRLHDFHGFCALTQDLHQYIQVTFKRVTKISGVASQGDALQDWWVTSFKIRYSTDYKSFTDYTEDGPVKVFAANTDRYSVVKNFFLKSLKAKSVRVLPLTWNVKICMRIELYGCPYVSECSSPLGMYNNKIRGHQLKATTQYKRSSFSYQDTEGFGRLNHYLGWCPTKNDHGQHFTITFSSLHRVSAFATQGRPTRHFVTRYTMTYSPDGKTWLVLSDGSRPKIFIGNFDERSVVKHYFRPPLELKMIRFYPKKWANGICMQFELYGCPVSEDDVIFDFEQPNLNNWKFVSGDKEFKANPKFSFNKPWAPTHQGAGKFVSKGRSKGLCLSPEFTVKQPVLSFMLGGKPNWNVKIELLVKSRPVYTYHASPEPQWHIWRVSDYVGKKAQLRFNDQTASYGFEFDHLQFGLPRPQARILFDFEEATLDGWQVSSCFNLVFGDVPNEISLRYSINHQGDWWLSSGFKRSSPLVKGERTSPKCTGSALSPLIKFDCHMISFLIGGTDSSTVWFDILNERKVALYSEYLTVPNGCETMQRVSVKIKSDLIGKWVYVRIADFSKMGYISFDDLRCGLPWYEDKIVERETSGHPKPRPFCQPKSLGMDSGRMQSYGNYVQIWCSTPGTDCQAARPGRIHPYPGSKSAADKHFFPPNQDKMQWWRCVWQEKKPFIVSAVATEAGDPFINGDNWVTGYRLEFSFDAHHFEPYKEDGKIRIFQGNRDRLSRVYNYLKNPTLTLSAQLRPYTWHGRIAMRLDFFECEHREPKVDGTYIYQRIKKEGSKIADYEAKDMHMRFLPAMEFERFKYRCYPCKDDYCREKMGRTDFIFAESGQLHYFGQPELVYIKPNGESATREAKLFGVFDQTIGTKKRVEMRVAITGSDVLDHVKGVKWIKAETTQSMEHLGWTCKSTRFVSVCECCKSGSKPNAVQAGLYKALLRMKDDSVADTVKIRLTLAGAPKLSVSPSQIISCEGSSSVRFKVTLRSKDRLRPQDFVWEHSSEIVQNKHPYEITSGGKELIIKQVSRDTAGVYTVRVRQPSDKQEAEVNMQLLLDPEPVILTPLSPLNWYTWEGENVLMKLAFEGTNKVTWTHNNVPVVNTKSIHIRQNSLELKSLTQDMNGTWAATVARKNCNPTLRFQVFLINASRVVFATPEQRAFYGTTTELKVNISGGNPPPGLRDIRWEKGVILDHPYSAFNGSGISGVIDPRVSIADDGRKLIIKNVNYTDAGIYRVTVDNKRASPSSMMELVVLVNQSTGNPHIMVERTYYDVILGQNLNISIKAQGIPVPRPDQIQWLRFNNTLLSDSGRCVLDKLNSTLHMYNITREELGLYQVVVTTITGTTSVRLTVEEFYSGDDEEGILDIKLIGVPMYIWVSAAGGLVLIVLAIIFVWRCVFSTSRGSTKAFQSGKAKSKTKKKNVNTTKSGQTVTPLGKRWPPE